MSPDLLARFMTRFSGFGNPKGDYWLVSLEGGGGGSASAIERSVTAWNEGGRLPFDDLKFFNQRLGETRWFERQPSPRPAWQRLIHLVHGIKGRPIDEAAALAYQRTRLGRFFGETCMPRLMPLPSTRDGAWPYADLSPLRELRSRDEYLQHRGHVRLQALARLLNIHRPRNIVYLGAEHDATWWSQLMPARREAVTVDGVDAILATRHDSVFAVVPDPEDDLPVEVFQALGTAMRAARP